MDLNDLAKKLITNKVNVAIQENEFSENHVAKDYVNKFDKLGDIMNPILPVKKSVNDSLLAIAICVIEPTASLLPVDTMNIKISDFETRLMANLDASYKTLQMKKYGVSKDDILRDISIKNSNRRALLTYLSKLINTSVCLPEIDFVVETSDRILIIDIDNFHTFTLRKISSFNSWKQEHIQKKIEKYANVDMNNKLLKDLKIIADELLIPTFKVVDGKKCYLLKSQLKTVVDKFINVK